MSKQTPFRIGGVYQDGHGAVYRLLADGAAPYGQARAERFYEEDGSWLGSCFHWLVDGRLFDADDSSRYHLLPGELHQVDGQWVPVEDNGGGSGCVSSALEKMEEHFYGKPTLIGVDWSREPQQIMRSMHDMEQKTEADVEGRAPLQYLVDEWTANHDRFAGFIVTRHAPQPVQPEPFAGLQLDGCIGFKAPKAL